MPVVVITASVQPKWARIVNARSDFPHPFQFCFSKKRMDHIAQNRPGSDLNGLVRVWPNVSGLEASWCAGIIRPGSGRTQPARYQFSTFRLGSVLPDILDNIVQNQPRSDLVLADCVRFWPNGSSPEASQYARIIRPTFGQSDLSCLLGKQLFWVGSRSVLSLFKQHKYLDFLCVCDPRSIKF